MNFYLDVDALTDAFGHNAEILKEFQAPPDASQSVFIKLGMQRDSDGTDSDAASFVSSEIGFHCGLDTPGFDLGSV